jgi:hypothetical protein
MAVDRVQFQDIVASQLPRYVREDFPLLVEFLEQYYLSQEYQGATLDLVSNLDQYVKVDELFRLKNSTVLLSDISYSDTTIQTSQAGNFTEGFPERNGLIKIGNEIITYEYKTDSSFVNCTRGFSGVTSYTTSNKPDQLTFSTSEIDDHEAGDVIYNLNILFLQEFFKKLKRQVVPGFADRALYSGLDQRNFIYNADSFYKSKGTDESFEILFRALYGVDVDVIKPSEYLLRPSNADYKITRDFVVEEVLGDPLDLKNLTLFQNQTGARGSVSNVEQIQYDNGQYYRISIDYGYQRDIDVTGSVFSEFKPNPQTKILNTVSSGSTIIDVDSTVGFGSTGNIIGKDADGNAITIQYLDKNDNQFLSVSGVSANLAKTSTVHSGEYSYAYVGLNTSETIQVKVSATLKNLNLKDKTQYFDKGDRIRIQSIGIESDNEKTRNWLYNVKSYWNVESVELSDDTEKIYEIRTFDDHFLKKGYKVLLSDTTDGSDYAGTVTRVASAKIFFAKIGTSVNESHKFDVENLLLKGSSTSQTQLNDVVANVQNVYNDFDGHVIVASNSVPNYDQATNPYIKKVTITGTFTSTQLLRLSSSSDHGFYTGDAVWYSPGIVRTTSTTPDGITVTTETESKFEDIDEGIYYVFRENQNDVRLSRSKADLFAGRYITFNGTVENNKISYYDFYNKELKGQRLYRSILPPVDKSGDFKTSPGYTGILVNGVEILNYKSIDTISYGDLRSIEVSKGGSGYDVINPPALHISDEVGTGATGVACINGQLDRIEIIDPGFDYKQKPVVKISGGNGKDAAAEVNLSAVIHSVRFNAELGITTTNAVGVGTTNDTIGFSTFHKFATGEKVVYDAGGLTKVSGLSTNAFYFVGSVNNTSIKLYNTANDAIVGVNTVDITSLGSGTQSIRSSERKNIVSSIVVTNPGTGYQNKRRTIPTSGINTSLNQITITGHGYASKEIVQYAGTNVIGLSTTKDYFVVKVNDDTFSLSEVGTGSTDTDYFYDNNILVDITSEGTGTFNYKPIVVSIVGTPGLSTNTGQDFNCTIQPVFRGQIESIDLSAAGVGYGSSEIINFNRQPDISFKSGEGAQLKPVINNGSVVDVVIDNQGSGYNSPPNLTINTVNGKYCVLTPILDNGRIVEVKVIKGGIGYSVDDTITVTAAGVGAIVDAKIRTWNINLFERYLNNIEDDDGVVDQNISDTSLQYSHLYAPRELRSVLRPVSGNAIDNSVYGSSDLTLTNGVEVTGTYHSPIIGWAYDGNPIYGPYGFANASSGTVTRMSSGYTLKQNVSNRPPTSIYPSGFFVEDYEFTSSGSLDRHNGRFCITPDYPNGVYAYFTTINSVTESSGPFLNYRRPVFPYLIGDAFHSEPNLFNYRRTSNQNEYDIQTSGYLRNTRVYGTNGEKRGYDYIFNSDRVKPQIIEVSVYSTGAIDSVGILTGGTNYAVNDQVFFNNEGTGGRDADVKVHRIGGRTVDTVSVASTEFYNVEFIKGNQGYLGFATVPHGFLNGETIQIAGISTAFKGFNGSYSAGIRSDNFVLSLGIGTIGVTGDVAYLYVSGALNYPNIRSNDILGIGTERVKVLNIDSDTKRIRVLRAQDGTVGVAHSSRTILYEDPRKFVVNIGGLTTTKEYRINSELYFDPAESVGTGTERGTGTGTTITFSNPGVGATRVFVPTQAIYYPNHGLQINDPISYETNGGTPLSVWDGVSGNPFANLNVYSNLYAAPITKDLVGISSNKVGVGSTGYVGINTVSNLLYFVTTGVGNTHSFTTNLNNVISGEVSKNTVTVSTASTHRLNKGDTVYMNLKPYDTKTVVVKYNDYNRRIVFDPRDFASGDVDINLNTIGFGTEFFSLGDRVIHTSSSPSGGLVDQKMYYVVPYNRTNVRLVENKFELTAQNPRYVDITSASSGTLSLINPRVKVNKNNSLKFDLSDSSLGFINNSTNYAAFDMDLYLDKGYNTKFLSSGESSTFEVTKTGTIGVDSNANLTLTVSDYIPDNLYYKFTPINLDKILNVKENISIDNTIPNFNEIEVVESEYSGTHTVSGIGTTTFTFTLPTKPEETTYNRNNSNIVYETNSKTEVGPITQVKIYNGGYGYFSLPGITSIRSGLGSGAILEPQGTNIGSILDTKFNDIGFEYPSDETVRAVANVPEILKLNPLYSFDRIGISSGGTNYLVAPQLVVLDGYTGEIVEDVELKYELGDPQVKILKNTFGIYNAPPTIIPTSNSNGIGVNSIRYTAASKTVELFFDTQFSDAADFPFAVGDRVLVEGVNVGIATTGTGYNSKDYSYALFELTSVDAQLGGAGANIAYTLDGYIGDGDYPGNVDFDKSSPRAIPEHQFPIFDSVLKRNSFNKDEVVKNEDRVGIVEKWEPFGEILTISTPKEFKVGTKIIGQSSKTEAIIERKINFNAEVHTGAGATVYNGWQSNSGFLNDNQQRMPNNEYYQNLSYSLKSPIPFETWNDPVSALNHTSGFAKFADLEIESIEDRASGIVKSDETDIEVVVDIIGSGDLNCFYDFDLGSENSYQIGGILGSDTIFFENRILQDYFQSVGNRVLEIDNISSQFNSNARTTPYAPVATFSKNDTYAKMFTYVKDLNFTDRRTSSMVSVFQKNSTGFIQEYAETDTHYHLGSYDHVALASGEYEINFYPEDFEYNAFDVSAVSVNIFDNIVGVASTNIGSIVLVDSFQSNISAGDTTTIASIASTYRTSKLHVQIEKDNEQFAVNELSVIHDGTEAYFSEYGDMTNTPDGFSAGFGTFHPYISGDQLKIDFIPNVSVAMTSNVNVISIANTEATGISSVNLDVTNIISNVANIAASGSPTANTIASYHEPYETSYFIVSVEDLTNDNYEMFEVITLNDDNGHEVFTEYGNIASSSGLGTVGLTTADGGVQLTYTPIANAEIQVRTLGMKLQVHDDNTRANSISLNNTAILANHNEYTGTLLDLAVSFGIKHDGLEVFRRSFDGSDSGVLNLTNDTISIVDHFFVTGERVNYSYAGTGTTQAIEIATTTIAGVSTDKLPHELYIVKIDDVSVKVAASASEALAASPTTLDFTSVGIGTSHSFTSLNPNPRVMVAVDNIIQSPLVSAGITHALAQNVLFERTFAMTGINSIFSQDLIQIEDEIMLVTGVGVGGANNITVRRGQMGTAMVAHLDTTLVTKLAGNYNISGNTLNFTSPPFGNVPIGTTTGSPDEEDWAGITTSSTFQGRVFMRSGIVGSSTDTYAGNYVFDDISKDFTGIASEFTLAVDGQPVTGFSTDNGIVLINGIFQIPQGEQAINVQRGDYEMEESGITTLRFTGGAGLPYGYDVNRTEFPVGGLIVNIGSTEGFGYQPLVAAGGTAIISGLGTVSSISIGNSGSGYRPGAQTIVNVGVQTASTGTPNIEFIGTAAISGGHIVSVAITNPGSGYTSTNPPVVVFDEPLPYDDIPLIYSASSPTGIGTGATVNMIVGAASSVIDFQINNLGYGYGNGEILTVAIGGTVGIPTDTTKTYDEFQISIDQVFDDTFGGYNVGQLQVLDYLDRQFDGFAVTFDLEISGNPFSAAVAKGSRIKLDQTLLVFLNDILQQPGVAYQYKGGSTITFTEPPKVGDTGRVLFYKGTADVDVAFIDVLETVKVGDTLDLNNNPYNGQGLALDEDPRVVTGINTVDSVKTNPYSGPGIVTDRSILRPLTWCKQTVDRIINGQVVGKDRTHYEPLIYPSSYLIQPVGVTSFTAYVDSVRPLYNGENEATIRTFQETILINSQDVVVAASATAVVSAAGTVSSLTITNAGTGYTVAPEVTISNPVGLGSTQRASATATISGGVVSTLTVTGPGTGYTSTNPPVVLIGSPKIIREKLTVDTYSGDNGVIVGLGTTVSGAQNQFFFDLFIPINSFMRDADLVGTAVTVSGISTGDFLVIYDTDISIGSTFASQDTAGSSVGLGTTFIDCVYQVASSETRTMNVTGIGNSDVRRIFVNVDTVGTGFGYTEAPNMGNFSWGKIVFDTRTNAKSYNTYLQNGVTGLTTAALVTRFNPLKYENYIV